MCTVTWLREPAGADVKAATGYRLWFNRDELRARAPERPAARRERGGVAWLAPEDGAAGGTWIAANEFGLTVGLLNGYLPRRGAPIEGPRSRGLLVSDLADAADLPTLEERLEAADLGRYETFVLLALDPRREARVWRWDGRALAREEGDARLCPLASSGVDQPEAQRARRALFEAHTRDGVTQAVLDAFQRSHGTGHGADHGDGASALTPCMHRAEAETRSQVRVSVSAAHVALVHAPGPPCRTADGPTLVLARRSPTPAR